MLKGLDTFMESGKNRMISVAILVVMTWLMAGYNFANLGADMDFLIEGEIQRIETNIEKQIWKITYDPEDIKKEDFKNAFLDIKKLETRGDKYAPLYSRLKPLVDELQKYYNKNLI